MLAQQPEPTYLSIDKDVFSPSVVRTNWDQGQMTIPEALRIIKALSGSLVGSDITGKSLNGSTKRLGSAGLAPPMVSS